MICYECKKLGHIGIDCPLLKSSKKSKKAMKATWDDSSESERGSDVEDVTCIYLMAHSDKDELDDEVNLEPSSYDELFETFESMQNNLEKLSSKYVVLKKKIQCIV